jgi:hypothetical protein
MFFYGVESLPMDTHVKVLAVLYIVFSALGTMAAFVVASVFGVAGVATAAGAGSDAIALPIIGLTGAAVAAFLLVVSLPGFVAGIGLLKYKPWARILTIVLSALNLINIPLGTIVGVYGLYVLLSEEGTRLFTQAPAAV